MMLFQGPGLGLCESRRWSGVERKQAAGKTSLENQAASANSQGNTDAAF